MISSNWGGFSDQDLSSFMRDYAERLDKSKMECNKPRATPDHPTKSHVVKSCYPGGPKGGEIIRFGQQGVKGSPYKKGESEAYRKRRLRFKKRHAKNIAKGKASAAYWADLWKWAEGLNENSIIDYLNERGIYDFVRCKRPDGSIYGSRGNCRKPNVALLDQEPAPEKETTVKQEKQRKYPPVEVGVSEQSGKILSNILSRNGRLRDFLDTANPKEGVK